MKKRREKRELVNHTRQKATLELGVGPRLFSISMAVVVVNQAEAEIEESYTSSRILTHFHYAIN